MAYGKKRTISLDPFEYSLMLLGESKVGKEQPVSEPVLTEHGWVPMGEITVGTRVFGEDGNLYNVTGVYPQGVKDVFKVTFSDGTSTRCGREHLWTVYTRKMRYNNRKYGRNNYKVVTLEEMMQDYRQYRGNEGGHGDYNYKYTIPVNAPINFECNHELPVDPYILGLLLGDGGFTTNVVTFTNSEEDIYEQLCQWAEENDFRINRREFENHYQCTICDDTSHGNRLKDALRELGLIGCDSRQKFIPKEYLRASVEDRWALLSGIVNTDGSIQNNIRVSTSSNKMAEDIAELGRSLGLLVSVKEHTREDKITEKYGMLVMYNITMSCNEDTLCGLTLSEKQTDKWHDSAFGRTKTIVDISPCGTEECQCIMVDNPNHLYITKDYIVTHNTTLLKNACEKLGGDDSYLLVELGSERGADAIAGASYINCPEWWYDYDEEDNAVGFMELVEDICENKASEYPNLRVIVLDTYDKIISMAEQEVIRVCNRQLKKDGKPAISTINQACGGFGRGEKEAMKLIGDTKERLRKVGVQTWIIGHVKNKEITDVISGESYTVLSSDSQSNYFNYIKKDLHFLGLAYVDRDIITENKKNNKGAVKKNYKVTDETRKIKFRSDDYTVDSGSRFADIVEEIPLDADAFIKAIEDAIKAEANKDGTPIAEQKKAQAKAKAKKAEKIAEQEAEAKAENELSDMIAQITAFIKEHKSEMQTVKPIMSALKAINCKKPTDISSVEDAMTILALCE